MKKFAVLVASILMALSGTTARGARGAEFVQGKAASAPSSANAQSGGNAQGEADAKEIRDFQLTTAKLSKFSAATKAYAKVMKQHDGLGQQIDDEIMKSGTKSASGAAAVLAKHPEVASAIEHSGLSVHDYIVMTYTLQEAMAAETMKQKGSKADFSKDVSAENLAFAQQHYAQIGKILNSMSGGAKDDDDDD